MPHTTTITRPAASSRPGADLVKSAAGPGTVLGWPRVLLRAEGALVLIAAIVAYHHLGGRWWSFALLFLAPDLSMLGYLAGPRVGAVAYDAVHTYLAPGALALVGVIAPAVVPFALIWIAHLGFDRMQGYGLKYATAFADTHLGVSRRGGDSSR